MSRRRDDEHSREERDLVLGKALDELESPEYPPDFLASVWERVDAAQDATRAKAHDGAAPESAEGAAGGGRLRPLRRPRPLWVRRPILAAAAAVAIVAVVATVTLIGLPGISRVTGPEPVSAAEVIQKALRALSSGKTVQADVTEKYGVAVLPGPVAEYVVVRSRVLMRSDGSFRITRIGKPLSPSNTPSFDPYVPGIVPIDPGSLDYAYDAKSGVVLDYYVSSESPHLRMGVIRDHALGPPDGWANFQADLSAVALALQAGRVGTLTTATYEGRPVWVITMKGSISTRPPDETYSITIDQKTCLPTRLQGTDGGVVQLDYSWRNVRVDEPLPDTAFTFALPKGVKVDRTDAGFRRQPLPRIASTPGYVTLLPAWLPAGFVQTQAATTARSTTANGLTKGRHVVAVQYRRGFDTLTVTTRTVADPRRAATVDPIEWETAWAELVSRDVTLTSGAFAGVTARVVVAPQITIPHLYAVRGDVLLTVAGSATAKELVALAESLQPYRP